MKKRRVRQLQTGIAINKGDGGRLKRGLFLEQSLVQHHQRSSSCMKHPEYWAIYLPWLQPIYVISLWLSTKVTHNIYSNTFTSRNTIVQSVLFLRDSLVAWWLRIRLPMQGTWVPALVWEDLTCRGATKPVNHNYWACALELTRHNYWARAPRAHAPQQEKPPQWEARAPQRKVTPALRN